MLDQKTVFTRVLVSLKCKTHPTIYFKFPVSSHGRYTPTLVLEFEAKRCVSCTGEFGTCVCVCVCVCVLGEPQSSAAALVFGRSRSSGLRSPPAVCADSVRIRVGSMGISASTEEPSTRWALRTDAAVTHAMWTRPQRWMSDGPQDHSTQCVWRTLDASCDAALRKAPSPHASTMHPRLHARTQCVIVMHPL